MKKSLLTYSIIFLMLLTISGFATINLYTQLDLLHKKFPQVEFWSIGKNLICIPTFITLILMLVNWIQIIRAKSFHFENFAPIIKRTRIKKTFCFQVLGVLLCLAISIRLLYIIMHTVSTPLKEPGDTGSFLQTFFMGF